MSTPQAVLRETLRVLIVEDSIEDTDLLVLELRRGGYEPVFKRVDTAEEMAAALDTGNWDLVLSDYSMPALQMAEALDITRRRGMDLPFVIVSATIGEEAAVAAMKAGAHDYVLKHKLDRLAPVIRRALSESELRKERRELDEQLREAQKLESIGLLAGGVAHDFNNLLTGILGNASLITEVWSPPPEANKLLEDIVQAGERAADLTRQLLAYAGKGRFVIEAVDVSTLVREISGLISASLPKKVHLVLNLADDLPAIEADASQIQQLASNLLLNAAEAIGDRNGTVLISTGERRLTEARLRSTVPEGWLEPGQYVYLEVQDTGCGMEDDVKSRIFEPFFTTKFTGRGLGLAAALGIVRSQGGDFVVESTPGKGSRFEVLLPAAANGVTPRSIIPARLPLWEELSGTGAVLVVDDEAVVRRTAKKTLEHYGYTVLEAPDGSAGVELFAALCERIEVVLLDLDMPVMGGEEAYGRFKETRPEVEVILSSGYDEKEATRRFAGKGIGDFIQKPYTAAALAAKVKSVLNRRARRTAARLD